MLTFESWLKISLAPVELASALMIVGALIVFRTKERLPPETINAIKNTRPAPITRDEIVTAAVLIASFILFLTGGVLHLPPTAVCLGATFLLFTFGIIKPAEIGTGINWDIVIFIGISLGLGAMCGATGITNWLVSQLVPALKPISGNPFVFVAVVTAVLFAWHMVDIANFMPTFTLIPPMLPAIREAYGIDPIIFTPILALAGCAFFMAYQNSWALMGQAVAKERSWSAKQLTVYGTLFFAASIISLMIMVPFWMKAGLFG
jgi:hypothetical protein